MAYESIFLSVFVTILHVENIFVEVDQTNYTKVLDFMIKLEAEGDNVFEKIILRMGGFHVIFFSFTYYI